MWVYSLFRKMINNKKHCIHQLLPPEKFYPWNFVPLIVYLHCHNVIITCTSVRLYCIAHLKMLISTVCKFAIALFQWPLTVVQQRITYLLTYLVYTLPYTKPRPLWPCSSARKINVYSAYFNDIQRRRSLSTVGGTQWPINPLPLLSSAHVMCC